MKKAIVVVAGGNCTLGQGVAASLHHAAERWGAELCILTEKLNDAWHWKGQAIAVPDWAINQGYDEVAKLDADLLVRIDCPSPFDYLAEKDSAYVDLASMIHLTPDYPDIVRRRIVAAERLLGWPVTDFTEVRAWAANGGVQVYRPASVIRAYHKIKNWYIRGLARGLPKRLGSHDQALINRAIALGDLDPAWMPPGFNWIITPPRAWRNELVAERVLESGQMEKYVYHLASRHWGGHAAKQEILDGWDWQELDPSALERDPGEAAPEPVSRGGDRGGGGEAVKEAPRRKKRSASGHDRPVGDDAGVADDVEAGPALVGDVQRGEGSGDVHGEQVPGQDADHPAPE